MQQEHSIIYLLCGVILLFCSGCRTDYSAPDGYDMTGRSYGYYTNSHYEERLPARFETGGQRLILVDPTQHAWGAYDSDGSLVKAGLATAGGHVCPDEPDRSCTTSIGTYRINSLGDGDCKSRIYPKPEGGGLMPYCMYFNGGEALHGSPDGAVVEDNISHGCVRMRISDAEWLRYNFAEIGTKVVIEPY